MEALHNCKLDKGIYLDDKKVKGVSSYRIVQKEGENIAELTLKMHVTILGKGQANDRID